MNSLKLPKASRNFRSICFEMHRMLGEHFKQMIFSDFQKFAQNYGERSGKLLKNLEKKIYVFKPRQVLTELESHPNLQEEYLQSLEQLESTDGSMRRLEKKLEKSAQEDTSEKEEKPGKEEKPEKEGSFLSNIKEELTKEAKIPHEKNGKIFGYELPFTMCQAYLLAPFIMACFVGVPVTGLLFGTMDQMQIQMIVQSPDTPVIKKALKVLLIDAPQWLLMIWTWSYVFYAKGFSELWEYGGACAFLAFCCTCQAR